MLLEIEEKVAFFVLFWVNLMLLENEVTKQKTKFDFKIYIASGK